MELAVIDAHAPHVAAQRHLLELELVQAHGGWLGLGFGLGLELRVRIRVRVRVRVRVLG